MNIPTKGLREQSNHLVNTKDIVIVISPPGPNILLVAVETILSLSNICLLLNTNMGTRLEVTMTGILEMLTAKPTVKKLQNIMLFTCRTYQLLKYILPNKFMTPI